MQRFLCFALALALALCGLPGAGFAQAKSTAADQRAFPRQTRYMSQAGYQRWLGQQYQAFSQDTRYMSAAGYLRWEKSQQTALTRESLYMSPIGYTRWQQFGKQKSWVSLAKSVELIRNPEPDPVAVFKSQLKTIVTPAEGEAAQTATAAAPAAP